MFLDWNHLRFTPWIPKNYENGVKKKTRKPEKRSGGASASSYMDNVAIMILISIILKEQDVTSNCITLLAMIHLIK